MVLVSISDVIGAVKDFKRPLIEGEAVLEAGQQVAVGRLGAAENGILKIWCLCIQTSAIFTNPHTINVTLNLKSIHNRVESLSCLCKAGTSEKCKHAFATLMHLNKLSSEIDLEDMSCTDLAQQWGKLKKAVQSDYEAVPITEFCHFPKYKSVYPRSHVDAMVDQESAKFAKLIIERAPKSAVFLHSTGARSEGSSQNCQDIDEAAESLKSCNFARELTTKLLDRELKPYMRSLKVKAEARAQCLRKALYEFYESHVKRDKDRCIFIAQGTATQSEELWHTERCGKVTGSKIYDLYTYITNKKPNWEKKLNSVFNSKFKGNVYTVYGIECEPAATEKYASANGLPVLQTGLFVRPELPFLGYSADGIIPDENGEPHHLWEVKSLEVGKTTPAIDLFKAANCCDSKTESLKKKHKYYGQIQLGMLLLGCDFMFHSSVINDETVAVEEVPFDEAFAVKMVSNIIDLYFDKILPWLFINKNGNCDPDVADV